MFRNFCCSKHHFCRFYHPFERFQSNQSNQMLKPRHLSLAIRVDWDHRKNWNHQPMGFAGCIPMFAIKKSPGHRIRKCPRKFSNGFCFQTSSGQTGKKYLKKSTGSHFKLKSIEKKTLNWTFLSQTCQTLSDIVRPCRTSVEPAEDPTERTQQPGPQFFQRGPLERPRQKMTHLEKLQMNEKWSLKAHYVGLKWVEGWAIATPRGVGLLMIKDDKSWQDGARIQSLPTKHQPNTIKCHQHPVDLLRNVRDNPASISWENLSTWDGWDGFCWMVDDLMWRLSWLRCNRCKSQVVIPEVFWHIWKLAREIYHSSGKSPQGLSVTLPMKFMCYEERSSPNERSNIPLSFHLTLGIRILVLEYDNPW